MPTKVPFTIQSSDGVDFRKVMANTFRKIFHHLALFARENESENTDARSFTSLVASIISTINFWDFVDGMLVKYHWLRDFIDDNGVGIKNFDESSNALATDPEATIALLADFVILGLGAQFSWQLRQQVPIGHGDHQAKPTIDSANLVCQYLRSHPEQTVGMALKSAPWRNLSSPLMQPSKVAARLEEFAALPTSRTYKENLERINYLKSHPPEHFTPNRDVNPQTRISQLTVENDILNAEMIDLLDEKIELQNRIRDLESSIQAVRLPVMCQGYRKYLEDLSGRIKSYNERSDPCWQRYWKDQVDKAMALGSGPIWTLIQEEGGADNIRFKGAHLYAKLSTQIHKGLHGARFGESQYEGFFNRAEQRILDVIEKMAIPA